MQKVVSLGCSYVGHVHIDNIETAVLESVLQITVQAIW